MELELMEDRQEELLLEIDLIQHKLPIASELGGLGQVYTLHETLDARSEEYNSLSWKIARLPRTLNQ